MKKHRIGAGISFIDEASVKHYKNNSITINKLRKITTVNKINQRIPMAKLVDYVTYW